MQSSRDAGAASRLSRLPSFVYSYVDQRPSLSPPPRRVGSRAIATWSGGAGSNVATVNERIDRAFNKLGVSTASPASLHTSLLAETESYGLSSSSMSWRTPQDRSGLECVQDTATWNHLRFGSSGTPTRPASIGIAGIKDFSEIVRTPSAVDNVSGSIFGIQQYSPSPRESYTSGALPPSSSCLFEPMAALTGRSVSSSSALGLRCRSAGFGAANRRPAYPSIQFDDDIGGTCASTLGSSLSSSAWRVPLGPSQSISPSPVRWSHSRGSVSAPSLTVPASPTSSARAGGDAASTDGLSGATAPALLSDDRRNTTLRCSSVGPWPRSLIASAPLDALTSSDAGGESARVVREGSPSPRRRLSLSPSPSRPTQEVELLDSSLRSDQLAAASALSAASPAALAASPSSAASSAAPAATPPRASYREVLHAAGLEEALDAPSPVSLLTLPVRTPPLRALGAASATASEPAVDDDVTSLPLDIPESVTLAGSNFVSLDTTARPSRTDADAPVASMDGMVDGGLAPQLPEALEPGVEAYEAEAIVDTMFSITGTEFTRTTATTDATVGHDIMLLSPSATLDTAAASADANATATADIRIVPLARPAAAPETRSSADSTPVAQPLPASLVSPPASPVATASVQVAELQPASPVSVATSPAAAASGQVAGPQPASLVSLAASPIAAAEQVARPLPAALVSPAASPVATASVQEAEPQPASLVLVATSPAAAASGQVARPLPESLVSPPASPVATASVQVAELQPASPVSVAASPAAAASGQVAGPQPASLVSMATSPIAADEQVARPLPAALVSPTASPVATASVQEAEPQPASPVSVATSPAAAASGQAAWPQPASLVSMATSPAAASCGQVVGPQPASLVSLAISPVAAAAQVVESQPTSTVSPATSPAATAFGQVVGPLPASHVPLANSPVAADSMQVVGPQPPSPVSVAASPANSASGQVVGPQPPSPVSLAASPAAAASGQVCAASSVPVSLLSSSCSSTEFQTCGLVATGSATIGVDSSASCVADQAVSTSVFSAGSNVVSSQAAPGEAHAPRNERRRAASEPQRPPSPPQLGGAGRCVSQTHVLSHANLQSADVAVSRVPCPMAPAVRGQSFYSAASTRIPSLPPSLARQGVAKLPSASADQWHLTSDASLRAKAAQLVQLAVARRRLLEEVEQECRSKSTGKMLPLLAHSSYASGEASPESHVIGSDGVPISSVQALSAATEQSPPPTPIQETQARCDCVAHDDEKDMPGNIDCGTLSAPTSPTPGAYLSIPSPSEVPAFPSIGVQPAATVIVSESICENALRIAADGSNTIDAMDLCPKVEIQQISTPRRLGDEPMDVVTTPLNIQRGGSSSSRSRSISSNSNSSWGSLPLASPSKPPSSPSEAISSPNCAREETTLMNINIDSTEAFGTSTSLVVIERSGTSGNVGTDANLLSGHPSVYQPPSSPSWAASSPNCAREGGIGIGLSAAAALETDIACTTESDEHRFRTPRSKGASVIQTPRNGNGSESSPRKPMIVHRPRSVDRLQYFSKSIGNAVTHAANGKGSYTKPSEISMRFADIVDAALQAEMVAAKVRSLRMATRSAHKACRAAGRTCRQLAQTKVQERKKSFALENEIAGLSEQVEELRQQLWKPGSCFTRKAEDARSEPFAYLEEVRRHHRRVSNELQDTKVRADAERLVFNAVLVAIGKMSIEVENAPEEEKSLDLPGVSNRSSHERNVPKVPPTATVEDVSESPQVSDSSKGGLSKRRSAVWFDTEPYVEIPEENSDSVVAKDTSSDLVRLRRWLDETLDESAFNSISRSRIGTESSVCTRSHQRGRIDSTMSNRTQASAVMGHHSFPGLSSRTRVDATPSDVNVNDSIGPELSELLARTLAASPKLIAATAPEELRRAVEDIVQAEKSGSSTCAVLWSEAQLTPHERARVLREGVAVGAVDPMKLAAMLGREDWECVRESYFTQWVRGWLGPYLERRRDVFGPAPQERARSIFAREPQQKYWRQCGRVLVDGMRDAFGRATVLIGVEWEATSRLLEEFAQALCGESEVRARFAQVLLPEAERPKDVNNLEDAVFLLASQALLLHTALHNPKARGHAPTKQDFANQGRTIAGVQPDFCKKMYDLIKAQPFGFS